MNFINQIMLVGFHREFVMNKKLLKAMLETKTLNSIDFLDIDSLQFEEDNTPSNRVSMSNSAFS